jgi:hypothetical protein
MEYYMEDPLIKQCSICLDEFKNEEICITNCNHNYCNDCLTRWFEQNKVECPLCRSEIKNFFCNDTLNNIVKVEINNQNHQINLGQESFIRLRNQNVYLKILLIIQLLYSIYDVYETIYMKEEIIEYKNLYENCTRQNSLLQNTNNDLFRYLDDIKLLDLIKEYGLSYLNSCFLPIKYINHCMP